jgi:hypothetical protein
MFQDARRRLSGGPAEVSETQGGNSNRGRGVASQGHLAALLFDRVGDPKRRRFALPCRRYAQGCPGKGIRLQYYAVCNPSTSCPALCRASTPRGHRELQELSAAAPRGWPGQARPRRRRVAKNPIASFPRTALRHAGRRERLSQFGGEPLDLSAGVFEHFGRGRVRNAEVRAEAEG